MSNSRGTLFLVVGPSGSGKDSLIDGAKNKLNQDSNFVFPRRFITRPENAGGEDHVPVTVELFETMKQRGKMILDWEAHNLSYGISETVGKYLSLGRNVVINVSRTVVETAVKDLAPVKILYVTVDENILRERLTSRGRENAADIERRIQRAGAYVITGDHVITIDNSNALEMSISNFVSALTNSTTSQKNTV